jgi:hypothetical protein
MRPKWLLMIPFGIGAIAIVTFLGGTVVKVLWNWLIPDLFGARPITFWQAFGLLALCRILFGGLGRHGGGPRMTHRMTPEERERFRRRLRERFGFGPPAPTTTTEL